MPDAHTPDAVSLCDDCATTAAIVRHSGQWRRCSCGVLFNPVPFAGDAQEFAPPVLFDASRARIDEARAALHHVLRDLELARRYVSEARSALSPAPPSSPLAVMQGRAGGASRDASQHQVATMWAVLQRDGAERVRRGFVDALLKHCDETSRAVEEIDWVLARRCAERLHALVESGQGAVLRVLARELRPGATWREAALLVADACAPRELRATWGARIAEERGDVGRPRRDATRAPVEAEQAAWGEARLVAAVSKWTEGWW